MTLKMDRIALLFNVIEQCGKHGPKYGPIQAEAAAELEAMLEEGKPAPKPAAVTVDPKPVPITSEVGSPVAPDRRL